MVVLEVLKRELERLEKYKGTRLTQYAHYSDEAKQAWDEIEKVQMRINEINEYITLHFPAIETTN